MPGLRYGPDITDDAASLMKAEKNLRARLRTAQNPKNKTAIQNKLKAIDDVTKRVFGTRTNRNRLSQYSLERQGYAPTGRRGGGRGLRRTPLGKSSEIPRRTGFRAREAIPENDRDAYRAAKKAARGVNISEAIKAAQKQSKARTDKANRAKKKAAVKKKATRPGRNSRNR